MGDIIFTESDLKQLQDDHPAYRAVAQEIERVTNNAEFAEGLLVTLLTYVRDNREQQALTFNALMRSLKES